MATLHYGVTLGNRDVVIAPVASDGTISVSVSTSVNFQLVVTGWYRHPIGGTGGNLLTTTEPTEVVDTAAGTGACVPGPCARLSGWSRITIDVTDGADLPPDAQQVIVSVIAHTPSAGGYIRIGPNGTTDVGTGGAATLNYSDSWNSPQVDTMAVVPIRSDGTIQIGTTHGIDLIVTVVGYHSPATDTWTYAYDSTGLRTTKQAPDGGTTTDFTWDRASGLPLLLAQHDGTDTTSLIYGPGGTPLKEINSDGSELWYHQDHLGSTRLTTTSTGTEHARYSYDAYGTKTVDTTPSGGSRPLLTYTGQYTDAETGNQYLRARYYDPTTAQFLTRDPLIHSTEEPYSYASGDPNNKIDPSGRAVAVAVGGTLVGGVIVIGGVIILVGLVEPPRIDFPSLPGFTDVAVGVVRGLRTVATALGGLCSLLSDGSAASADEAPGESNEEIAAKIASGHSWSEGHAIDAGVESSAEWAALIEFTLNNYDPKLLPDDREAYWDDSSGVIVIYDPNHPDKGTAFAPDRGKDYYDGLRPR